MRRMKLGPRDVANYETVNYKHLLKMEQNHPATVRRVGSWSRLSLSPRALKFVNNSASSAQRAIVAAVDAATTGMYTEADGVGSKKKKR